MSFFGGLDLKRIEEPEICSGNSIRIASQHCFDLARLQGCSRSATCRCKDTFTSAALMRAGVDLSTALAAGRAVYGERFDPAITLRALGSFDEGNLGQID